jgi:NAD(P)H-hydrate epimerase
LKVAPSREGTTFTKIILDADALKLVAPDQLGPNVLVTPHAGEFALLFGQQVPEGLVERVALVRQVAERYRCNVVLKGSVDVIAGPVVVSAARSSAEAAPSQSRSPTSRDPRSVVSFSGGTFLNGRLGDSSVAIAGSSVLVKVNRTGNAGMTKGGTGDVLAGLIAALACKNDLFLAGGAGAYLNGLAGDRLQRRVGFAYNASDLVEEIPLTLRDCLKS